MARRTARLFLTLLVAAGTLTLSGCSGLFFFPDRQVYLTPDRLNLQHEDIYLDTADGESLHGWWLPAMGAEPLGTVYYLHGNAQNISSHLLNVAWLPERGYNVFLIDYRGYGQSSGEPDIEGALHDVESGLRWLASHHYRDDQPLILLGQSLGGALAIAFASEWAQQRQEPSFDAVVLDASFSGFRTIAQEKLDSFWLTWPLQVPLSWTIPDDYEGINHIAAIAPTPVMVIHSINDTIIPFHHGPELYTAAGNPKTFLRTDTPHAATFIIPAYREAVLDFLAQNTQP
ncbi:alpha/beta hydrolase [Marinobacter mobilis]|uniref:Serine aminopeptidase S33 domain-containing protein n=1 Tax=Marinobacter mobilis TaxID=488533 RepID=A0A1H2QNB7_9GAMM|nr:alpha/beta hydrolase [Marinobacter mobilis]SDW08621.1 hypothetical protein SAMN04487960_101282 [Marinobacter mobilis]